MPQPASRAQPLKGAQTTSTGKKPVDKFQDGPIHVSIWENQGAKGAFRTASVELRYKDSQEQWQTGHSYTASDLRHLETAACEARSRIENWRHAIASEPAP